MTESLALLGGKPVRNNPYPLHTTIVDDAEERAVLAVLSEGHLSGFSGRAGERFLGGPKVLELEEHFARYFGVRHAISFNSATSALHAAVAASGIGPGDEVITSPYTMSATASAILMQNAIPIFADIEDRTYGLDPQSVERKVSSKTRGILTVNLFGHPSRLSEIRAISQKYKLSLIEDNAQSPAATYHGQFSGTIGEIGILSLNYHKAIQTGEGGVALTNDPHLTLKMQLMRNHGEAVVDDMNLGDLPNQLGWNYRLTELQAAIGICQLEKLEMFNGIRRKLASLLTKGLEEFDFLSTPVIEPDCTHSFYLYPFRYHADRLGIERDLFVRALKAEGIAVSAGYAKPLYLYSMYQKKLVYGRNGCPFTCHEAGSVSYEKGICPTAERLYSEELITTDICKHPNTEREIEEFVVAVQKIQRHVGRLKS